MNGAEDAHEELGGLHDEQRRRFRALERDRLGRELAEHDVQRRHDRERDGHGDAVGRGFGERGRQERQERLDEGGQGRFADPAEAEARHGDAQLRRGDVAVGVGDGAAHGARAAMILGDQLIDARLAHRDDGEFGGDEKAVGQHQGHDSRQAPQHIREVEFGHLVISSSGHLVARTDQMTR